MPYGRLSQMLQIGMQVFAFSDMAAYTNEPRCTIKNDARDGSRANRLLKNSWLPRIGWSASTPSHGTTPETHSCNYHTLFASNLEAWGGLSLHVKDEYLWSFLEPRHDVGGPR